MDEFIEKAVQTLRKKYTQKMFKDKRDFFEALIKGLSSKEFYQIIKDTWKDRDFDYMDETMDELYKKVDDMNKVDIKEKTIIFYEVAKNSRFDEVVDKYINDVMDYYQVRKKIADKVPDKLEYLNAFVEKYDKQVSSIPYFNKDGTIHSWHTVEDYSGMLFNTKLTRSAWNRTLTDAKYLDIDTLYLPAHPFACPHCMQWQGKFYSTKRGGKYTYYKIATDGGVGHPRCRHTFTIAYDETVQQQADRFDSSEWEEKYKAQQKLNSINNQALKYMNDLKIQKKLNSPDVEKIQAKIDKLKKRYNEIKKEYDL